MSKIICDVCGTTYQDTAECCPICGCTQDDAAAMLSDEQMMDDLITGKTAGGSAKKRKEIFDFDEVNTAKENQVEAEVNPYEEEEDYYEEPAQHNTLAVILLTVLIVVLLGAAAFLFIRFYLPGIGGGEEPEVPTTIAMETTAAAETTVPGIPCESLALTSGMATGDAELLSAGQKFLINVIASPADTTDAITFESADESIATVTSDGQVTAVGEGETVIYVSCGKYQIPCKVVCNFSKETEPPVETTAATEAPVVPDVVLKVKKTDVMLAVYYEFQLMLDCELKQTDVKWRSEHPHIASVDEEGVVRALQPGTTSVIAEYNGQTASCIVRCHY